MKKRVIILGAAGRDFHNFNTLFRDNEDYEVVAFTATQIPDIEGRTYPPELAGRLYPKGIKIYPEADLLTLIKDLKANRVVFSYSDIPHEYVMHRASLANAAGADFILVSPERTMLKSTKPVISICAVRTGCGKSQTTRKVAQLLKAKGRKVVIVRHPMPYGDLKQQIVQRFASYEDLEKHHTTIEEREEYEGHLKLGFVVYAGVDYEKILRQAEKEADIILWDGGNNDTPFFKSDLEIVVVDPHRVGHELTYHPGETNFLRAHVFVINKMDSADPKNVETLLGHIEEFNPTATVIKANSKIAIEDGHHHPKKILVVEDGPTLTHGGMDYGAGAIAAQRTYPAAECIEPERFAVGTIKAVYKKYPHVKKVLPAMGYSAQQLKDLSATIEATGADLVLVATPIDLRKLLKSSKPMIRVFYELEEIAGSLSDVLRKF